MAADWSHWAEASTRLAWPLIPLLAITLILFGRQQGRQHETPHTIVAKIPSGNHSKTLTLRIQGIPTNVTHNELLNELENLSNDTEASGIGDSNVFQLSLVRKDRRGACATVTFRSLPRPLEAVERKSRIVHRYAYDVKFLGITPVYEGHGHRDSIVE
jgi:hypothetical protein